MRSFHFTCSECHPSGLGAWTIMFGLVGDFSVTWKMPGQETQFGSFQLTGEDYERVWGFIEGMHIAARSSSKRMGIPDEVRYTFILQSDNELHRLEVWRGETQNLPSVQAVVFEINELIEKYTGQKAYL